ncbi:MAG: hypothetical protein ACRDKA_02770 [Actinomycetota bacterium]
MGRRARQMGFEAEEVAARFPDGLEAAGRRGGRHGHGLGLRPSRYVGKHRVLEETGGHAPVSVEKPRRAKKVKDYGFGA